jgi:hypothetical protein
MSSTIEKIIEDWLAQIDASSLPGKGKPLDLDEYFRTPADRRVGHNLLKNAGFVPDEVELMGEIGRLKSAIAECGEETPRLELKRRLQEAQVRLNMQIERSRAGRRH